MASFPQPAERYDRQNEAQFRRALEQMLARLESGDTGWVAMTGTTDKDSVFDTATVTLPQLAGRVMALQAALAAKGFVGR